MGEVPVIADAALENRPVSAILRLVQASVLSCWRATGEDLYREVARLANLGEGNDALVVGCGRGVTTEWLATKTGASLTGVDTDASDIEYAEEHAQKSENSSGRPLHLSYLLSHFDDLPYDSNVFDAVIGEPEVTAARKPLASVRELVRVARPMAPVILLQVTWSSDITQANRDKLAERFGIQPKLVVEWKQCLRDAGVVDIHVDDWTSECDCSIEYKDIEGHMPANWQDLLREFTHPLKRSGWKEAKSLIAQETDFWRELLRERALCFSIIKGTKWNARGAADVLP